MKARAVLIWCALAICGAALVLPVSVAAAAGTTVTSPTAGTSLSSPDTSNPFSPGVPESSATTPTTTTTPTVVTTSSTSSGGSFTGTDAIIIAIVAVVILGGISWFVFADARRHAPVRATAGGSDAFGERRSGSKAPPRSRKLSAQERKRRKRGKTPRRR